ncbi:MAG TPA: crosslink repair DNA glycosylase YcaQ family protein [Holophagaceae bacterium]|nr:crosslink repair DNA glycosylase YcaQ family protein [Holophagaceae bacterium]
MRAHPTIPAADAARLLLGAQGLLEDPSRKATKALVRKTVEALGFVQLDSIATVARAHDLTLRARLEGYRPEQLQGLLEKDRACFEHWTHDASAIPVAHYAHWRPRFKADEARMRAHAWWNHHFRGTEADEVLALVRRRITEEGPLMSADFEHPEKRGPWWGWKPQKAALDFLWRSGVLAIRGRRNFHKIYDLAERVHPEAHALPEPEAAAHVAWACGEAAPRLGCFTPRELAQFWDAIGVAEAKAWCEAQVKVGALVPVQVESADGRAAQNAFAVADWEARLRKLPAAPEGIRLLAPFDPILRDRDRALRRFGFDYRFEAFVPEPKRQYGYYVLPLLEGERLVGRLDPKLHRDRGVLEIKGLWWEAGVKATKVRKRMLQEAVEALALWLGAEDVEGL